jgi:diaminopimelate decarboxylase
MNDLLRPSLYSAWQDIKPVERTSAEKAVYDVVGPVCETGDFLGKDRHLAVGAGDILAVMGAGAYGMVMSSNYNTRWRAAEVMISGDSHKLIRPREDVAALLAPELELLNDS